ncbi:MAG: ABC transporter ATP-binding protein [Candidatus Bathyarchaeia archaeon]
MARVRLEHVTKKFGDVVAVNDLTLEIKDKEFVCLLGPSGCGKTTTLRMIAGVETPTSGEIYFDDELVTDLPSKDRDIAMVFQFYVIYPGLSPFDQIAFPLKVRKVPKDEIKRRVKEVTSLLGIEYLLNKPISQLTVDERQRIELARALVRKPRAYLLDEPLTNLDAKLRAYMRAEIKRLFKSIEATTIYVTHDQIEAMSMADRIAVMNFGVLQQYDSPDRLYDRPRNLFVAGFIGSPPMNFINCTFIEKDGRAYLDSGEFLYDISIFAEKVRSECTSQEVVLGVRPEHIDLGLSKQKDGIEANVLVLEPMGHRELVHVQVGNLSIVANIETQKLKLGQRVWLNFAREKIRIFDKKTEQLII